MGCEYDKPIFDRDYNNLVTPNSPEITVRSEEAANEMSSTPETIRENSPEFFPETAECVTKRIEITTCSRMLISLQSNLTIRLPTHAAQSKIYVIIENQTVIPIADFD